MSKQKGAKDLVPGGMITEAGNAREYETGDWRTEKPEVDHDKCIHCFFCWAYCPDSSIIVDPEEGKMKGFDFKHCKGCGICARICPKNAITMVSER